MSDGPPQLRWWDLGEAPLEGRGWAKTDRPYDRLPHHARAMVTDDVWALSRQSAGLSVRFESDSTVIAARWRLRGGLPVAAHMPATSVFGLDLYAEDARGLPRWVAVGRPKTFPDVEAILDDRLPAGRRRYTLHLPLYCEVAKIEVGVEEHAAFSLLGARPEKPAVFYGTSIVHGIAASRPGMTYPAILGRRLSRPVINLGFSGRGRMEASLANLLGEIDGTVYVVDCLPNMDASMVSARCEAFVRRLTEARPRIPIVLMEDRTYANGWVVPALAERQRTSRAALMEAFSRLVDAGVEGLHYVPGNPLLGEDDEATVDGTHPTDLGFMRIADHLAPVLARLLRRGEPREGGPVVTGP